MAKSFTKNIGNHTKKQNKTEEKLKTALTAKTSLLSDDAVAQIQEASGLGKQDFNYVEQNDPHKSNKHNKIGTVGDKQIKSFEG
jgi:hypothetical protein